MFSMFGWRGRTEGDHFPANAFVWGLSVCVASVS